jgi:hypothetical protein
MQSTDLSSNSTSSPHTDEALGAFGGHFEAGVGTVRALRTFCVKLRRSQLIGHRQKMTFMRNNVATLTGFILFDSGSRPSELAKGFGGDRTHYPIVFAVVQLEWLRYLGAVGITILRNVSRSLQTNDLGF